MTEATTVKPIPEARQQLNKLEGHWKGHVKVWFEGPDPVDESEVEGTIRPAIGGKFMFHEYKGSFQGKALEGLCIIAYNSMLKRYESAWVDSFHSSESILYSEGDRSSDNMSVLGSYAYVTPEAEIVWGWRTSYELRGNDELVITAFNRFPDGNEAKAVETVYKRVNS